MTTETKPFTADLASGTCQEWESASAVEVAIDLATSELHAEQPLAQESDAVEEPVSEKAPPAASSRGLLGGIQGQSLLDSTKPMLLLISALCIGLFISSLLLAL